MSEILQRLRAVQSTSVQYVAGSDIMREAADEIERLAARLADTTDWYAEAIGQIDDVMRRLAEAEALLRWARINLPNDGMRKRIDAFLAPDSASGAAHSCVIDRFGYGACGVCGRSVAQHSAIPAPFCKHGNMVGGCVTCAMEPDQPEDAGK